MRRKGLALAAAVAGILGSAAPAHAAGEVACQFTGATGNLSPSVAFYGNTGSFTYAGTGDCVINGLPSIVSISMSGTYDAQLCGAATYTGTMNIPGYGPTGFKILFEDFSGPIIIDASATPGGVAGTAHMDPGQPPDPLGGRCYSQATIAGWFYFVYA
jgi:hypothetical protein